MAKDYSDKIRGAVEEYFDKEEWKHLPISDSGIIKTGVSLKCKLRKADVYANIGNDYFSVTTVLQIGADEDSKSAVAEFIVRANYGLKHGRFDMDFRDGEIRFRTELYCGDTVPTYEQIATIFLVNIFTVDRYGDALTKVMYGIASPFEAIEELDENN